MTLITEALSLSGREWVQGKWEGNIFHPQRATICNSKCSENSVFHELPDKERTYDIYNAKEATKCLNFKKYTRIIVVGDSYMRNLFAGLYDVLIDRQTEISQKEHPQKELEFDLRYPAAFFGNNKNSFEVKISHNIALTFLHQFGLWSPLQLNLPAFDKEDTLILYGSMVHDHKFRQIDFLIRKHHKNKKEAEKLIKDKDHVGRDKFKAIAHKAWMKRLLEFRFAFATFFWVTSPYYETFKLEQVNHYAAVNQNNEQYLRWNIDGVNSLLTANPRALFLDAYHLTESCVYQNCSRDGAHRASFVNRMKFQIILNVLCKSKA